METPKKEKGTRKNEGKKVVGKPEGGKKKDKKKPRGQTLKESPKS